MQRYQDIDSRPKPQYKGIMNNSIQFWRGFAILIIFLFHIYGAGTTGVWSNLLPSSYWLYYIFGSGAAGVDIFFIIAGYLAVGSIKRSSGLFFYLRRRIARIYPVYLTMLIFIFSIGPITDHSWLSKVSLAGWLKGLFINLLLLPGVFDFPIAIPVAWCISYIFMFYILWGLVYRAYNTRKQSWIYYVQMTLLLFIVSLLIYQFPRFIYFIVGILVYYTPRQKINPWVGIISLMVMLSMLSLGIFSYAPNHELLIFPSSVFAYVFFLWAINTNFNNAVMIFLGNISYSFFLVHTFVMHPMKSIFNRAGMMIDHPYLGLTIFSLISFSLSIFIAWVLYNLLEKRLFWVSIARQET
jgi:peptidoglycan/LPS O-acetylase OafA/YrhL